MSHGLSLIFAALLFLPFAAHADNSTVFNASTEITGIFRDVFHDDVDGGFFFLSLDHDNRTDFIACPCTNVLQTVKELQNLQGCLISLKAQPASTNYKYNRKILKEILTIRSTNDITVVASSNLSPFDAPLLSDSPPALSEISTCGLQKIRGSVVARWQQDSFLIHSEDGYHKITLRNQELPSFKQTVEAVGNVSTDLYRFNLTQARWRPACFDPLPERPPERIPLKWFYRAPDREAAILNTWSYGQTYIVRGFLKNVFNDEAGSCRLLVSDGNYSIVVDCSGIPQFVDVPKECSEIEITGVCIMNSEDWHPGMSFPKVSGLFLVPHTAADIKVLRQPPWWTPARFAAVVIGLLALLATILVWNATLRILVARKSRALLREQTLKLSETLKIDERTRLAAELHDFHSQNLTAIAYRISAARNACRDDPKRAEDILTTATQMLKSCRTELRRCLWDLRNDALDKPDFAAAIRETVLPVAREAKVSIRFAGHRAQICDSTAYALLCILRELTANAVIHGHATSVHIAGEQLPQAVRFSVQDDGSGFDPAVRPGQNDGHFGLDGIRERLNRLDGTLDIRSRPGEGTYVRLSINSLKQVTT